MKTKHRLILSKRFWVVIVAIVLIGWYTFKPKQPWYTAYEGPNVTIEVEGKSVVTPLRTWRLIHNTLVQINKEGAPDSVYQAAIPLWNHLGETAELLSTELPKAKGVKIDFIAMIHPSPADPYGENTNWMNHIKTSHEEVIKILSSNSYDVIGRESSWSIPFSESTLIDENLNTLRTIRPNCSNDEILSLTHAVKSSFMNSKSVDGVMYYKYSNPNTFAIGIEDKQAYRLHAEIAPLIYSPSLGQYKMKSRLNNYDRFLVWFRTELAVAKMLKIMRERNLSRGVIVMGQAHRYCFEVLSKQFSLESTIYNTVPEKVRSDEP